MNNFIKFLSSSQRFQDFAGVARGTYKVLAGINPIDISSPILKNEIHKNQNINLKEQSDVIKSKKDKKNVNNEQDKEHNIKMTENINNSQNTKSFNVDTDFPNKNINSNKNEQYSMNKILDQPTQPDKRKFENENIKNERPSNMRQSIDNTSKERDKNDDFSTNLSDSNKSEMNSKSIRDLSENEENKKTENPDLVNYKSKPGSSNIDLIAKQQLKEKKIPATAFSRAISFGQLGLSVLGGGVAEAIKQNLGFSQKTEGSGFKKYLLTENTAEKISDALCKMRGAPLKLGQILSIQEDALIPKPLRQAFEKARKTANIMPQSQVNGMLNQELGDDWNLKFKSFDMKPFAAASIGQVHMGVTSEGHSVAIKIQYPGVRESVDSDLENLKRIMDWSNVFPKTMFLEELIKYTRKELMEECDYDAEREKQEKYRNYLSHRKDVYVPKTFPILSTSRILTAELINGVSLDFAAENLPQSKRNEIGKRVMSLTLEELFKFNYMQTDPNPANYFYNVEDDKLFLLDFGATRAFPNEFLENYIEIIKAATEKKIDRITDLSKVIGFLTGEENRTMLNAHENSIVTVGEPFAYNGEFDFGSQTMTEKIYKLMPVMFRNRLKAPPPEVYSLHRKLSGAFLINMKLRTKINCQEMFEELYHDFRKRNKIVKINS